MVLHPARRAAHLLSRKCLCPGLGDPVPRGYVGGKRNTPLTSLQAPPDNEHLIKIPCTFGILPLHPLPPAFPIRSSPRKAEQKEILELTLRALRDSSHYAVCPDASFRKISLSSLTDHDLHCLTEARGQQTQHYGGKRSQV